MNVYNGERFLEDALNSLLAQTHADWELIFWDSQSGDKSKEIFDRYSDSRFHYFCAPVKTTLGMARNNAIQQAKGKWLAFLDQDDLWLPHKLEKQMEKIRTSASPEKTALVYGRTASFDVTGQEYDYSRPFDGKPLPEGNIFQALMKHGDFICISSLLVRKDAFLEMGGIPEAYHFAEDYYLLAAIANRYDACVLQKKCCRYRVHENSMTQRLRMTSHLESLQILELWAKQMEPGLYRERKKVYHTLIGWEKMSRERKYREGLITIFKRGSWGYLLGRPWVKLMRLFKQTFCRRTHEDRD